MTDDARTLDFLEGGGTLVYDPQAPDLTAEQIASMNRGRAAFDHAAVQAAATVTANRNAAYREERAASDQDAIATSNESAAFISKYMNQTDWGLLPAAVAVVGAAVTLAASGGLAAPAVGALWKQIKSVSTFGEAKAVYDEVKSTADDIQARTSFEVPDLKGDQFVAAHYAADMLLGGDEQTKRAIVANTLALANAGNVDAQRGAIILTRVAGARMSAGLKPSQVLLATTTAAQAANVATVIPQTFHQLTAGEMLTVSDVRQGWWKRFVHWLEGL